MNKQAVRATENDDMLTIQHILGEEWDNIVAHFDGVVQEQLYIFAKNRWPSTKCEPILFLDKGKIIGGAMVLIQDLPLKLGSIAIIKWGPILKSHDNKLRQKNYEKCIAALIDEYDKRRKIMLSILPRASFGEKNCEYEYLLKRGFFKGGQLRFPNRYFVNLRLSDDEQRNSFTQKWRYHLRKSEKNGLIFEHARADRLNEFDILYRQMNERKKFVDNSAYNVTINELMAIKNEKLRPELFFVKKQGEIVAGAIIFKAGECATYLYGATNEKALNLRAGYFLHWHIIRWLRDNCEAKYYDLGGTDGYQGLHQFKKGMVGTKGIISPVPPMANYSSHFFVRLLGNLAFFVREIMIKIRHILLAFRKDISQPDQKKPR